MQNIKMFCILKFQKELLKKIAKQASDRIGTIEMLEYIRKNPIDNK